VAVSLKEEAQDITIAPRRSKPGDCIGTAAVASPAAALYLKLKRIQGGIDP
jgi:hypothetical protein